MRILIFGFGRSGKGAARLALKKGESVYVYDDDPGVFLCKEWELLHKAGVDMFEIDVHKKPDLVVLSPNIPLNNPLLSRLDAPIISELQYAMRFNKGKTVAVSGTNGKTTTCTLLHRILSMHHRSFLLGNVGKPLSEEVDDIERDDFVVLEVSSFQLESSSYFRPNIACLINIAPDHMDRHSSMDEYASIKRRLCADMGEGDYAILNADESLLFDGQTAFTEGIKGLKTFFVSAKKPVEGCYLYNDSIFYTIDGNTHEILPCGELKTIGSHNAVNAMLATAAALLCGISTSQIAEGLRGFNGLEHRTEYVDRICGIPFYNDSKATNPHAAMSALDCFDSPLAVIMGGSGKNLDYDGLISSLRRNVCCIFIGETKNMLEIASKKAYYDRYSTADSLREAVRKAFKIAKDIGGAVLLSPAAASFDMFKSYEQRGECFKALVSELKRDIDCG